MVSTLYDFFTFFIATICKLMMMIVNLNLLNICQIAQILTCRVFSLCEPQQKAGFLVACV